MSVSKKKPTPQEALSALHEAVSDLREAVNSRGGAATDGDGLRALKGKVGDLVRPAGREEKIRASACHGHILKGDPVTVHRAFETGETLRFAVDGATILATAHAQLADVSAVLFFQNGATKLKLFRVKNGEIQLGNTVTVTEAEIYCETIAMERRGPGLFVLYNEDGDGKVAKLRYTDDLLTTLMWTGVWMEGGDPYNIVAECHPAYGVVSVVSTRLPVGSTDDESREAVIQTFYDTNPPDPVTGVIAPETVLTGDAYPALTGLAYSKDEYAQGWAMACFGDVMYVTYPKPNETGRGILTARGVFTDSKLRYVPGGYSDCPIMGSIPSVSLTDARTETYMDVAGGVLLCHGVTRMVGKTIESFLAVELWITQQDDTRPLILWMGGEDVEYSRSISRVCGGVMGEKSGFAGYSNGTDMYAVVLDYRETGAVGGPAVRVGSFQSFATLLPAGDGAVCVYQKDGNGYIRTLAQHRVVARSPLGRADAIAMDDSDAGGMIRVVFPT